MKSAWWTVFSQASAGNNSSNVKMKMVVKIQWIIISLLIIGLCSVSFLLFDRTETLNFYRRKTAGIIEDAKITAVNRIHQRADAEIQERIKRALISENSLKHLPIGLSIADVITSFDVAHDGRLTNQFGQVVNNYSFSEGTHHLVIFGDPENISGASLIVFFGRQTVAGSVLLCTSFLNNTIPEWKNREKWFASAINIATTLPDQMTVTSIYGEKEISFAYIGEPSMRGLSILSIKHKDAN